MKIYVGSDHAGFVIKTYILEYLNENTKYEVFDVYCLECERCDYPDCAEIVCDKVVNDVTSFGILICGTGIGISIAANKINNIRCALCNDTYSAEMARKHNNANVLALAGRILTPEKAIEILKVFLENNYEYGRHNIRLAKIKRIEYNPLKNLRQTKTTYL